MASIKELNLSSSLMHTLPSLNDQEEQTKSCSSVVNSSLLESLCTFQAGCKQAKWYGDKHPMVRESMSRVYGSLRRWCWSETSNSVRMENAGSHQCEASPQSESADETPTPQMSTVNDPQHLYIFPCNCTGSWCVMNANNEGVGSLLSEPVEECVQLIMQDSAILVMVWLLFVWVVRLWATHWILCFSFLTCKTGEQLDLRDVVRMFTKRWWD